MVVGTSGAPAVYIAAQTTWRLVGAVKTDLPPARLANLARGSNRTIEAATFSVELRLTKHKAPKIYPDLPPSVEAQWSGNERHLSDEAFEPRLLKVKLETGIFKVPLYEHLTSAATMPEVRYGLRLTFDPSPVPPRLLWKDHFRANPVSAGSDYWNFTQFCAQPVSPEQRSRCAVM